MNTATPFETRRFRDCAPETANTPADHTSFWTPESFAGYTDDIDEGLNQGQRAAMAAVRAWVQSEDPELVLTGQAGTGKTYLAGRIIEYITERETELAVAALTHKAASVLAEKVGCEVTTVHSLLKLRPISVEGCDLLSHSGTPELPVSGVILIDEASMIDDELLGIIRTEAAKVHTGVIYIGDQWQLPPVDGRSAVFADDTIPRYELTEIQRQAADNPIIRQATLWRAFMESGANGPEPGIHTETNGAGDGIQILSRADWHKEIKEAFHADPERSRVIAFTNEAVVEYNRVIRAEILGPVRASTLITPGECFVSNAPVVQLGRVVVSNNQVVTADTVDAAGHESGLQGFNVKTADGAVLFVPRCFHAARDTTRALKAAAMELQRRAKHGDRTVDESRREAWRRYYTLRDSIADLRPPHACTVHKSQGSTFRTTFIDWPDLMRCRDPDTRARLVYTALTRASHRVVVCMEAGQ